MAYLLDSDVLIRAKNLQIKIPSVCIGLRIDCMSPFQMLRREHARFVLPAPPPAPPLPPADDRLRSSGG